MRARQPIVLVQLRIVPRGQLRDIVGLEVGRGRREGSADNLLHRAGVEVDAGSEFGHGE